MNNIKHLIFTFIILTLGIYGCTKAEHLNHTEGEVYLLEDATKSTNSGEESYIINERDIRNYIAFQKMQDKEFMRDNELQKVTPIEWNDAICLYVLEYDKGYEVLSADKRSQVPLVKDQVGKFEFPTEESPLGFHIYTLAEDVWFSLYNNDQLDKPDKEAIENIKSTLTFWNLVNADFKTIQSHSARTKSSDDLILDPEEGHWEQISVSIRELYYDTSEHLVTTWWHQDPPFNDYCPYDSTQHTSRCPAGCVAVAGAQVINYLHHKLGVPEKSPSHGHCSGYVYNNTVNQSFGLFHSSTWDNMMPSSDPYGYAAMLIGYVGKNVNMSYGANSSGANTLNLKDNVFIPYGINCTTFKYYNGLFLKGDLGNGIPVICGGTREYINSEGNTVTSGHAFIVDRYKRYQEEITFTHEWVFDNPELNPGYPITRTSIVYNTPYITHYQMNWGYGYEKNYNNVWCSMSGSWQYGSRTPYIYNRKMVCNFSVL